MTTDDATLRQKDAELFGCIDAAPTDKPYVVAQLGQSLDGRIATLTGESRWINGASALDHLHRLRARVDAVVVGIGTVLADDPQLTVRRVAGPHPARVIIDTNCRLPLSARCLAADGVRCIVIRSEPGPIPAGAEVLIVPKRGAEIAPGDIAAALFQAGLKRILIEGGAATVSKFIDAGAADRLHLLVAPIILGSGLPGLTLAPIAEITAARRPLTRIHLLDDGDVLFDCELRCSSQG